MAGTFLVTPPSSLVVSVADQKAHLRIDTGAEDSLIQSLIEAAIAACEHETNWTAPRAVGWPWLSRGWAGVYCC